MLGQLAFATMYLQTSDSTRRVFIQGMTGSWSPTNVFLFPFLCSKLCKDGSDNVNHAGKPSLLLSSQNIVQVIYII